MTDPSPKSLEALRDALDAIDRDVLELVAKRMDVVTEIAAHKRQHQVRIRDLKRERAILDDRCERAEALGLPKGGIESVWRLLMLMSRDKQAALRAEVPPGLEPKTIAIIGGLGGMGRSLQTLFSDLGHHVLIADLQTDPTPVAAAQAADVVVVSVPIRDTHAVIEQVGPHVKADGLLMDVTSIKSAPLQAMLASTQASVVGTHPMFGPGVNTYQHQRVVVCKGRGDDWHRWVLQMMRARGLVVTEATAEEHDQMMAVVQVLHHFKTQALGLTLARLGISLERSLSFTSPAYLLEAYVAGRHFAQDPELYGPIEMLNPKTAQITGAFERAVQELTQILVAQDQARFSAIFDEVRAFFGEFSDEALEQSGFLIDRLVELSAGRS